jgi:hypothetical protein
VIGFVSEDAGGANLVLHHALKYEFEKKICSIGVSSNICRQLFLNNSDPNDFLLGISSFSLVIAGANYRNSFKQSDYLLSKIQEKNIPIHGYLDGWVFYDQRYPMLTISKYLVVDEYSFDLAEFFFPGRVELVPNYYFEYIKKEYNELKESPGYLNREDSVLFLTQPKFSKTSEIVENHGNNCICQELEKIVIFLNPRKILIRDHPRLDSTKCIDYCRDHKEFILIRTRGFDPIAADFLNAKTVIGAPSTALYFSKLLGLDAFTLEKSPINWRGPKFDSLFS